MNKNLTARYKVLQDKKNELDQALKFAESEIKQSLALLEVNLATSLAIEKSLDSISAAKPLLAADAISQCEKLANQALASIFNTTATVTYSKEDGRFLINEGDYDTDLKEGNGGGYLAVISFVFSVFLLLKMKGRLFLCFDEAFTQISSDRGYFDNFFTFLKQLVADLNMDVLLITHDSRIDSDMVDSIYYIEDGKTIKQK